MSRLFHALAVMVVFAPLAAQAAVVDVKMLTHASNGTRGFEPALVRIHAGDTVHFIAADPGHNVQSISGMIPEGAKPFSGPLGHNLDVTFTKPGIYGYKCLPHYFLGMVGLIEVDSAQNESAVKAVSQPGAAKTRFAQLFDELDHH